MGNAVTKYRNATESQLEQDGLKNVPRRAQRGIEQP